ncbi:glutamic acid-rich protein-like [Cucumis melo var. makuwa]|uniref:Glutamic acid-rich protein-like n=1 Tax=Cucumis melo var. makuwa TaxID=1194695 RepID=A0A5D3E5M2_CUCMM|nr:glutamic acid-rich protein-like [Cucumis melo var. makuwa]TYK30946.1 glutamic acid-rich protein-like [Cucumis melo var. makuwa]
MYQLQHMENDTLINDDPIDLNCIKDEDDDSIDYNYIEDGDDHLDCATLKMEITVSIAPH